MDSHPARKHTRLTEYDYAAPGAYFVTICVHPRRNMFWSDLNVGAVIGHLKRYVSKQLGFSIWQKSFIDRVIRNQKGYDAVWEYIDNNPFKLDFADDPLCFENL